MRASGVPFAANDSIADQLSPEDVDQIERDVAARFEDVLDALLIDRDHNTRGTAKRVASMYVRELFRGRYEPMPCITEFPNVKGLDELYAVGPISVRSTCSHHFCAIEGEAWCGIIPGRTVLGLSKFARLTSWIMSRPQIQEEAVVQLADTLERLCSPIGLGVVVRSKHHCMTMRGVNEHDTVMTTSVVRGKFRTDSQARAEFFALVRGQGF